MSLKREDRERHARLGIDAELLTEAGVLRVTDRQARDYGIPGPAGTLDGLLYPHYGPDEQPRCYRVRRDAAPNGLPKYVQSRDRNHWAFPPDAAERCHTTTIPVVFVEAEKSMLMLESLRRREGHEMLPIALGGASNWRARIGKTTDAAGARVDERGPCPDFDLVDWPARPVVILFDANADAKLDVRHTREQFARELHRRGAEVRIATTPAEPGVNGPDDYCAQHDGAAVWALIEAAVPWAPSAQTATIDEVLAFCELVDLIGLSLADLEPRLRRLAGVLGDADAVRKAAIVETLKGRLKAAKVPAGRLVDVALRTPAERPEAGEAELVVDDAPWDSPVEPAPLLTALHRTITRHVVVEEPAAVAVALWVLLTYAATFVSILPMLLLSSATKRSGKTTLLEVLGALVCRALSVSNITGPALFRAIGKFKPTLLLDEVDTFLSHDQNGDLTGMINSGHTRATAQVIRCVGDAQEPTVFSTWCPKVLAGIGNPRDTIVDRSIRITMARKASGDTVSSIRRDQIRQVCAPLRQQARRWVDDIGAQLRTVEPTMPAGLHDRAADNWRPLLALADLAGGDWPSRARAAAVALARADGDDEPLGVQLLSDLRDLFTDMQVARVPSKTALEKLVALEDRPWATWGKHDKPMTGHALARLLQPFGIRPGIYRDGATVRKGYLTEDFTEAWRRYVPSTPPSNGYTVTSPVDIDENAPANGYTPKVVTVANGYTPKGVTVANGECPNESGHCNRVTVQAPLQGDDHDWGVPDE